MSPGIRYILISTLAFAIVNVGIRQIAHLPHFQIVFLRAVLNVGISAWILKNAGVSPWGNDKKNLVFRGIFGFLAFSTHVLTLQRLPLASATTVQYISPIFTSILAALFLGESLGLLVFLCYLISFSGILFIKGFDTRIETFDMMIGVLSAFFSGIAYNFIRKLKNSDHPTVIVFYFVSFTLILSAPMAILHWQPISWFDVGMTIIIAIFTQIAQTTMTKAYQLENMAKVSIFNYLGIFYAGILGFVFFKESYHPMAIFGMFLVILGIGLSMFLDFRKKQGLK
jgi:drug/metabolite transporter (DMT)-like permease